MAVNLAGTASTCAAVVPRMVAQGRGSVVTISSDLGVGGSQGDVHHAASKGAIVGFTRALATELEGTGVAVNTVAPGAADTPMLGSDSRGGPVTSWPPCRCSGWSARRRSPLARDLGPDGVSVNELVADPASPPSPEVVAAAVSYLCSDPAGAVVGQLLTLGRGGSLPALNLSGRGRTPPRAPARRRHRPAAAAGR